MRELIGNFSEFLCTWCIYAMRYFSSVSGMSYEEVNILLFVVLGPLSTIIFGIALLFALCGKKKTAIYISIPGVIISISVFLVSAWCMLAVCVP